MANKFEFGKFILCVLLTLWIAITRYLCTRSHGQSLPD